MCFNANVSFGAGVVIGIIGIATIKKIKTPSQLAFASIPLIFAIQQFMEGVLWLALEQPDNLLKQEMATYTYLIIAQCIWSIFVPFSIFAFGKRRKKKKNIVSLHCSWSIFFNVWSVPTFVL